MDITIAAMLSQFSDLHARLRQTLTEADSAALDWKPAPETNSLAVLTMHMLGSEYASVAATCGVAVARDREAEFRTVGLDKAALLARLDEVDTSVREWLGAVDPSAMARVVAIRGRERTGALTVLANISHLAEHIGHAQLTYQLWLTAHQAG